MNAGLPRIVLLYSGGMGTYVTYAPIVSSHASSFLSIVRLPTVPATNSKGRLRTSFLKKMASASLSYLLFNALVSPLYDFISRFSGASIASLSSKNGIPHLSYSRIDAQLLDYLHSLRPDLIINASSFILTQDILDIPRLGVLNFHGAPLPQYRGAGNYFWVLVNGETSTHGTFHFVEAGLDTGDIVQRTREIPIYRGQTVFDVWFSVRSAAAESFAALYSQLVQTGSLERIPQGTVGTTTRSFPLRTDVAKAKLRGHRTFGARDLRTYISILFSAGSKS